MASITERQRTIINAIQKERTATREYLLMREKPLTAYQHYIKHMRARWNTLSEEERHKFNWRAAKKWGVTVYGGSQNYQPAWGGLLENYEGEAGNFTTYTNYKGESWTENH